MGNMSYCRFRNTLEDLEDCEENMAQDEDIASEEKRARIKLINLCCEIAQKYGSET